jgi:hypothetical protein
MFEGERRLGRDLKLKLEARWFMNTAADGIPDNLRRDRHVTLRVTRFF